MDPFATNLLTWFESHGRKDLPWQHPRTPYRVWLSEIMLQQTQVRTVIPYFQRFVEALPTLESLAEASQDQVLALWSGLGYYSRARNLHACAKMCVERHAADLPSSLDDLAALPGIGRSTAAAILAQAHGQAHAILDGNVRRVLARHHGVHGWPGQARVQTELWRLSEAHLPQSRLADYTQAIMDLGATLCTRSKPRCADCPLQSQCIAHRDGLILALPTAKPGASRPTRSTTMMIARSDEGRILLERRGPTGVWARLWSLPECTDATAAGKFQTAGMQGEFATRRTLPAFTHAFSHFQLHITPVLLQVRGAATQICDDPDRAWFAEHELDSIGLPAPIRKLLNEVFRESSCEPSTA